MYSTLKNPTNSRWIQVSFLNTFQGYWGKYAVGKIPSISIFWISYVTNSRETSTWKLFLDFGNPGKICNSEINLGSWKTDQKLWFIVNKKDVINALEWPFGTRNDYKLLKSGAPVTFLRRESKWNLYLKNTSPLKMLICTLIRVILLHSKHFQTPKNSPNVNTLAGCKFTFWQLPRWWTAHLKPRFEILH